MMFISNLKQVSRETECQFFSPHENPLICRAHRVRIRRAARTTQQIHINVNVLPRGLELPITIQVAEM
mgnify:CR=1 FL=1